MKLIPSAFTLPFDTISRVLENQIGYSLPTLNKTIKQSVVYFTGIWDTGATASAISKDVVKQLGLTPITMQKVNHAQGECCVNVYKVDIYLPNNIQVFNVTVTEGNVNLIGMDIISLGDFSLCNRDNKTLFSFQIPATHCYDFVKQIDNDSKNSGKKKNKR